MPRRTVTGRAGRLDAVLAAELGVPRAEVQRAIVGSDVLVDGTRRPKSFRLTGSEVVEVELRERGELEPSAGPVRVLFEDPHLMVVSKPAGVLTHPTPSTRRDTLVNRLLSLGVPLSRRAGEDRPGIVHRLDSGTSGVMLVAKHDAAHDALSQMFREHDIDRRYLALVRGRPVHDEFLIDAPLERQGARIEVRAAARRPASTGIAVRERFGASTLVEARPRTGRTHQIRVHLSAVGHPVLGDAAYGGGGSHAAQLALRRPFLHSWRVRFRHPFTGETLEREDPLPDDLRAALERARSL